jgi:hypothetical protein
MMAFELSLPRPPEKSDGGRSPEKSDDNGPDESLLARVRAEFAEMPGLSLTAAQARRFWQLEPRQCERILRSLVEAGFLYRTSGGQYRKAPLR